jgi:dTDP-4-dehydrorhamnose reductase
MSRILVIGASGYLGREIFRLCGADARGTHFRTSVAGTVPYDFFTDGLDPILKAHGPVSTIIFAAAVERLPSSLETFLRAATRFVDSVARASIRLIYVSSDAVFSGERGGYREDDTPDATTLYGTHLRVFESEVSRNLHDHVIVRVSHLFGDTEGHQDRRLQEAQRALKSGQVFPRFQNVFKSPVPVTSAAQAIFKLATSEETGIIHIPGERLSIFDFCLRQCVSYSDSARLIQPQIASRDEVDGFDTSLVSLRQ